MFLETGVNEEMETKVCNSNMTVDVDNKMTKGNVKYQHVGAGTAIMKNY